MGSYDIYNIYNIDSRIRDVELALIELTDTETGEIKDHVMAELLMDKLAELDIDRAQKIESACLMKMEADRRAESLGLEIKRLTTLKKRAETESQSWKEFVTTALKGEKLKTDLVMVYYRNDKSVNIKDEGLIPEKYCRIKKEPKKDAIKKAINAGESVMGAELVDKKSTIIR